MPPKQQIFPLKGLAVIIALSWTLFIVLSAVWNLTQHKEEVTNFIRQAGRSTIARDMLYRQWNAEHGGIYARIRDKNPPNEYLTPEITPQRDLTISADLTLTMINPAYMTRQIYELAQQKGTVSGHITSLNPINPKNKAAPWEINALNAISEGAQEYSETATIADQEYMRLLMPLWTEKSCLRCHQEQGYKEGDLRGGISVSLPFSYFHSYSSSEHQTIWIAHFTILIIGLLGIFLGYNALARGEIIRKKAKEKIIKLAYFDQLTGLVNRNLFADRVTQAMAMAKRQQNKVALLYIDLDHFKAINDNSGHEAGDAVLKEVAVRLQIQVRQSDTVARVGGDELVVILQGLKNKHDAQPLAEKIISAIQQPMTVKGVTHSVGASIGISAFPEDGKDMDTLLKKADSAMYQAKKKKGGAFQFS